MLISCDGTVKILRIMKANQRLFDLYLLHRDKRASLAQQREFEVLLMDEANGDLLKDHFDKIWRKLSADDYNSIELLDSKEILLDIVNSPQKLPRKAALWPKWVAAAAIVIAVFSVGYLYFQSGLQFSGSIDYANDIAPGKNGATLTLASGEQILINDAMAGNIAEESGVRISKTADGALVYEVLDNGSGNLEYNTLSTTRGEQTQVRLPDGTVVFLNAESALKYPTSFAKSEKRMVSLEGEGFFSVAKDKAHPFIVKTAEQEVEVLGTVFNVNTYKDDKTVKTTLLEGSVKVTTADQVARVLKPDQKATVSPQGILVENVEAQFSADWKEGFFMFDNETLESIMKRLSRWYAIKVEFKDASLKNIRAVGTVSKYDNISKVIAVLERGKLAQFSINDGVLSISQPKQ